MNKGKYIESFISWQGESVDTGKRMLILRVKKCNRSCIFNGQSCDTNVKMRISQEFDLSFKSIQDLVNKENAGILLTGGECTMDIYIDQTVNLINKVKANTYNIETNGCNLTEVIKRVNKNKNVKYILSPKLFNSTDFIGYKRLVEEIKNNKKVYLKIVTEDRPEIHQFLDWLVEINFDMTKLFLMPEGVTHDQLLDHAPFVFDMAEKYKCNFSSREHIIYGFV
jgi:organic radical activating enzyme